MRSGYGRSDEGRERPYGQRLFARPAAASRARSSLSPCRFGLSPDAFAALAPAAFAAPFASTRCFVRTLSRAVAPSRFRDAVMAASCDGGTTAKRREGSRRRLSARARLLRTRGPPRRVVQEGRELLGVELRHAGGAVAARLLACRDEEQAAVLDALHRRLGDAGCRRVALVVGGVDGKERRRDLVEARRRVVGGRRFPGIDVVVGVGGERRREAPADDERNPPATGITE